MPEEKTDTPRLKYRELLEGLGAAIFALDLEGRFTFVNPEALALFGHAPGDAPEFLGQHFTKLLDPSQVKVALDLFLRGREMRPFVLQALRKDGSVVTVEVSGAWVKRRGERVGALAMAWELAAAAPPNMPGKARSLTDLDMTILQLVARGLSNREIAERVYLSSHTIKDRIEKIMRYFGVKRRAELAAKAVRNGLV